MNSIGVIDVETTGLNPYRYDRVVEIAALAIQPDGTVLREFASLVNPERDVGPTSVHGLTATDVLTAPKFPDLAGKLCECLSGCVALAGHNVRFDVSFLRCEFERLGYGFPESPTLCTLSLGGGGTLSVCCQRHHVEFAGTLHSALHDARATARLLATLLARERIPVPRLEALRPVIWPPIPVRTVELLGRNESRRRQELPPTYLQQLLARKETRQAAAFDQESVLAYTDLLDRSLEDRRIDEHEVAELCFLAGRWGLAGEQIEEIHRGYVRSLAHAAYADGKLTETEHRDLIMVAHLLGVSGRELDADLREAAGSLAGPSAPAQHSGSAETMASKRVCFTGESVCHYEGAPLTRERASELAASHALVVVDTVTKDLDILVVADPNTQSGKAKKARKYGIRIMHEPVFWRSLGISVD